MQFVRSWFSDIVLFWAHLQRNTTEANSLYNVVKAPHIHTTHWQKPRLFRDNSQHAFGPFEAQDKTTCFWYILRYLAQRMSRNQWQI